MKRGADISAGIPQLTAEQGQRVRELLPVIRDFTHGVVRRWPQLGRYREDMEQDFAILAMRASAKFDGRGDFRGYVLNGLAIGRNQVLRRYLPFYRRGSTIVRVVEASDGEQHLLRIADERPSPGRQAEGRRMILRLLRDVRPVLDTGIVLRRLMFEDTLQQIGDELGVTRERVRQLEARQRAKVERYLGRRLVG